MHIYRRRYLLVELKDGAESLKVALQSSPVKVKLVKEDNGYAVLKADSITIDLLRQFIIWHGFKTLATSGTIKGLFRRSNNLKG